MGLGLRKIRRAGWVVPSKRGPTVADSVYDGETYDARLARRLEAPSLTQGRTESPPEAAGSRASARWRVASAAVGPAGAMVAWSVPPVRVLATVTPVSVSSPHPHVYVIDFGERRAGVVRLKSVACASGGVIVMRHAEILQHAGLPGVKHVDPYMVYTANLRSAKATDTYTCAGAEGGETWAPTLTYHGERPIP